VYPAIVWGKELIIVIPRSTAKEEFVYPRIPVCSAFELCKYLHQSTRGSLLEVEYGESQELEEEEDGEIREIQGLIAVRYPNPKSPTRILCR
jgi:hypothetical protein